MPHGYDTDLKMFIDGERIGGGEGGDPRVWKTRPTGEALGELPLAGPADLDRALQTAARGYRLWRARGAAERGSVLAGAARLLRERMDKIARIAAREEGKTFPEAKVELLMAAGLFDFYAGEVQRI